MADDVQHADWDGATGDRWAAEADRYDRMSEAYLDVIVGAADPRPGERVLDVGCGAGALSFAVADLVGGTGEVVGIDVSSGLLDVARDRAAATRRAASTTFVLADAQEHDLGDGTFDAVVSRFGVMFFEDPTRAFANLARALRPGGRMVFACWRDLLENDWIMVPAVAALEHVPMPELGDDDGPGAYSLADPDRVRDLLADAGLTDVELEPVTAPVHLGSNVDEAIDFMHRGDLAEILLSGHDPEMVSAAWASIRSALETRAGDGAVSLAGAVWLVTARTTHAGRA